MKNRIIVTVASAYLAFGCSFAQAQEPVKFIDTEGHAHEGQINYLADRGIVEGYGYGIFRPDIAINRAEFLKILMTAVYGREDVIGDQSSCFRDFVGVQQWYWMYACLAKQRHIIDGYPDGTFRGEQTVNLAEALKIAVHAWGIPVPQIQVSRDLWYLPYFAIASQRGLFDYFPKTPGHQMTRSEMAYLIVAMREPIMNANEPATVVLLESAEEDTGPTVNPAVCGNGREEPGEQCDDGNLEDGDGCSSICVVVEVPVYHGALQVEQRPVSRTTVAAGTEDVIITAFDFTSSRQDVEVDRIAFAVTAGDPDSVISYSLWVDTDSDEEADTLLRTVGSDGGKIVFENFTILAPEGIPVRAELHADLSDNITEPFTVDFDFADSKFVSGIDVSDGRELLGITLNAGDCNQDSICWINVYTLEPQVVSLLGKGNLFITLDSTPVPSKQLVLGESTADILRLKARTEGEAIEITDIKFDNVPTIVSNLYIFRDGESNPVSEASVTACKVPIQRHFCLNAPFVIEADSETILSVRALLKTVNLGGTSGVMGSMRIDGGADDAILAVGAESTRQLVMNDGDAVGDGEIFIGTDVPGPNATLQSPSHEAYANRIVSITDASDELDGTPVPTGTRSIGAFTFTAAESYRGNEGDDDVSIRSLSFSVTATNVQFLAGTFKLNNVDEPGKSVACNGSGITGDIVVSCSNIDQLIAGTIRAGESIELSLEGLILESGKAGSTSVLQTSLQGLGDPAKTGTVIWSDGKTEVEWVDIGTTSVRSTQYTQ